MVDESQKVSAKGDQVFGAVYRDFLSRNRLLSILKLVMNGLSNSLSSWPNLL